MNRRGFLAAIAGVLASTAAVAMPVRRGKPVPPPIDFIHPLFNGAMGRYDGVRMHRPRVARDEIGEYDESVMVHSHNGMVLEVMIHDPDHLYIAPGDRPNGHPGSLVYFSSLDSGFQITERAGDCVRGLRVWGVA